MFMFLVLAHCLAHCGCLRNIGWMTQSAQQWHSPALGSPITLACHRSWDVTISQGKLSTHLKKAMNRQNISPSNTVTSHWVTLTNGKKRWYSRHVVIRKVWRFCFFSLMFKRNPHISVDYFKSNPGKAGVGETHRALLFSFSVFPSHQFLSVALSFP